jgi:hypothetical protein
MKKAFIVILIFAGAVVGYWMAQENWRLFELAYRSDKPQPMIGDASLLEEGLEKWQVKQIMGAPDARSLLAERKNLTREEWRYGDRRLIFTNGTLVSWEKGTSNPN